MRGKERTVTDEWALPSSDTGKKREKGGVWLLGRRGYWARNGVLVGRPSRGSEPRGKGFRLKTLI
jgi:hypothetical protein